MEKRALLSLDKYVPFHFHPYTAFDVAVKSANDPQKMMYLCISREYARRKGFKIIPKHPLSLDEFECYDYDRGFNMIDWQTLTKKGETTTYAKEVKMAECVSPRTIGINEFICLYVPNLEIKKRVNEVLLSVRNRIDYLPYINIQEEWFAKA